MLEGSQHQHVSIMSLELDVLSRGMGLPLLNTDVSHYTVEPTSSPTVLPTSHPTSNTASLSPAKRTLNDGIVRDSRSLTLVFIWGGIEDELL